MSMVEYHQRVKKILPGGVHYNFHTPWEEMPIHFKQTTGSRVWDMDGKEYLDLYARFGANIFGHAHEGYIDALKDAMSRVLSVSHCDLDAQALEALSQHIPSAEMIRFGVSGTEIIQNALRLARAWTGKNRFVRFEGHYHGNADNIMGGKAQSIEHPVPEDFKADVKWTAGRATGVLESQSYLLPWNDIVALENLLAQQGDDIAAVIMEPVCVSAGSIMPAPGYLQKVRALCDQYHVVLIFDEIVTAVRMGLGGAQKQFDVIPDLTVLGKAIGGGGVPIAAMAGKQEIMQLLVDKKVIHAGTFNGYTLGTAAIKFTYEFLSEENERLLGMMNRRITEIHDILKKSAAAHDLPLVVQGPTACASFHCAQAELKQTSDYTHDILFSDVILNSNLSKQGILVSPSSRIFPSIALDENDIDWVRQRIDQAMSLTQAFYSQV